MILPSNRDTFQPDLFDLAFDEDGEPRAVKSVEIAMVNPHTVRWTVAFRGISDVWGDAISPADISGRLLALILCAFHDPGMN